MSFIPPSFRTTLAQPLRTVRCRSLHTTPLTTAQSRLPPHLASKVARAQGVVSDSIALTRSIPSQQSRQSSSKSQSSRSLLYALGLGTTFIAFNSLQKAPGRCEGVLPAMTRKGSGPLGGAGEQPPQSILNVYELGFGTVAGICAGVFLKKGLRAIAFLLGGAFIFLQYLSSKSYVTVDWARLSKSYDSTFGTRTTTGGSRAPTVQGVWNRLVDFVTANFQQRASFLAGFVLGVRLG